MQTNSFCDHTRQGTTYRVRAVRTTDKQSLGPDRQRPFGQASDPCWPLEFRLPAGPTIPQLSLGVSTSRHPPHSTSWVVHGRQPSQPMNVVELRKLRGTYSMSIKPKRRMCSHMSVGPSTSMPSERPGMTKVDSVILYVGRHGGSGHGMFCCGLMPPPPHVAAT